MPVSVSTPDPPDPPDPEPIVDSEPTGDPGIAVVETAAKSIPAPDAELYPDPTDATDISDGVANTPAAVNEVADLEFDLQRAGTLGICSPLRI